MSSFGLADYLIFSATLLLSSVIGIYHAIRSRKKLSTEEYVLASKSIAWFPIFVSMAASFFSAVGVMGYPAQIYSSGITFSLTLFNFLFPITLCAEVVGPLFRKLQLVSVNQYLEMRFSSGIRYLGCFFFHVQYLIYLSVVLYAPSLALNSVADVPLTATILSTGAICTFYTSLGGMRAVIWTDVFQSFVMVCGLVGVTVVAVVRVGSMKDVFTIAYNMDRLHISFSPDPKVYHTFWGVLIGLQVTVCAPWCIAQPTVQRVLAARTDKDAKKALYASFLSIVFIVLLLSVVGLAIFAFYANCDLMCSKRIVKPDQVLPYFIVNELGYLPGVPGLLTACIYSFALSTLSSGLNGMSALFLEDVAKKMKPDLTEQWGLWISKLVALAGGVFVTGFAFVVPKLGKYVIKIAIKLFGIVGGPYFSLFVLGIFTEKTNAVGAYIGAIIGFVVGAAFTIGQLFYPPDMYLPRISIAGCRVLNLTVTEAMCPIRPSSTGTLATLFSVSYCWHGFIAFLLALLFGYVASLLFPNQEEATPVKRDLLYDYSENFLIKKCFPGYISKYKVEDEERQKIVNTPRVMLSHVRKTDPFNRTKRWCQKYRIPTRIDEHPDEMEHEC